MTGSQASDVLVSFRGVQKSYDGENLIVKDLNLDIRKGEFLTLLGPSGSGKTTSLMMLAGFETPTAGEILLGGPANRLRTRSLRTVNEQYSLRSPCGPACGCYSAALRFNAAWPTRSRSWAGFQTSLCSMA